MPGRCRANALCIDSPAMAFLAKPGAVRAPSTVVGCTAAAVLAAVLAWATPTAASTAPVEPLTPDAAELVGGVLAVGDHRGAPFVVIDKRHARMWVLDASGRVQASTPVLLGLAVGDHTVPGIGDRPLEQVRPDERTTPAGRFGIEPGRNLRGEDILWVDYESAVSMHRVRTANKADRRLERLATPTEADNRISYGCINVPTAFYDRYLQPVFASLPRDRAAAYLLPETKPLRDVFPFLGR